MHEQERQTSVETALSQIVGDFGRKVSDDPVRLRNLLIDATGVDAMTLDAEINAVVAAAESQLPATLTSGDVTQQAEATQRLTAALGAEQAGLAGWATDTWTSVLNTTPTRPGAALGGTSLDATALPGTVVGSDATVLPSASVTEDATVVPGPTTRLPDGPGDAGSGDGQGGGDDRKPLLIGAFVGLVVIAVVVIALATQGGDDGEAQPTPSSVAEVDEPGGRDTSTTAPGADTPVATVAGVEPLTRSFEVAPGVDGARSITPGDRATTIELTFTNDSGGVYDGFWLEAAPAAFGRGLLDVQDPSVIDLGDAETSVFAVPLSLADGESSTVSYTTGWIPAGDGDLDAAASGFDRALQGWVERNGDPRSPSVAITSATTTTESTYTLTGVTEPMNTVALGGQDIDVGADGSFGLQTDLTPGVNTFEVTATSPLGVTATASASVQFDQPPEPTDPPETQNAAPLLLCTDDYVVFEGAFEGYIYGVPLECFSDPDGDELIYYSDIGVGAPPDQCPVDQVCWVYHVPDNWDGTPFEITAEIWAEDPEGLQSASGFLTMCLNCTP